MFAPHHSLGFVALPTRAMYDRIWKLRITS
jgi:hypothetical protein